jgi:hypothetical protein
MTEAKSEQSKTDAAAARAAKKAAEEAEEERVAKELRIRRTLQLEHWEAAVEKLEGELRATRKTAKRCETLANHSEGFYEETNKLSKGKTLVEATPLFVDQTNDIIRDAKDIVKSDVYLDRIKEFVPAGNNPVYPDVLVTVRAVRQSLGRCKTDLRADEKRLIGTLCRARTVVGALECFLSDEKNAEYAIKEAVETFVEGDVDDSCFLSDAQGSVECFDFEELDAQTVEEFLSIEEENYDAENEDEDGELSIDKALQDLGEKSEGEE